MKPGDVFSFTPDSSWCREGIALMHENGILNDTFWDATRPDQGYQLSAKEKESLKLLFNIGDYQETNYKGTWDRYSPIDRQKITSQHGLRVRWFIRNGASECYATQIENHRKLIREAETQKRRAESSIEFSESQIKALEEALSRRVGKAS